MGYYSALKINELSCHVNIWRNLKWIFLSERNNLKSLHTVWLQRHSMLEKAKLWSQYKDIWLPGVRGKRGMSRQSQRIYRGDKLFWILYLSKPMEYTTPRMNSNVSYGLWRIMICQCRSPFITNVSLAGEWWQWESLCVCRVREHIGISMSSSQFCYEPKTPLKRLS